MPIPESNIFHIDSKFPDKDAISSAAKVVRGGGVVVFPTSTFYGLGANAFEPRAVEKVFRIKKREFKKPLLILIASKEELSPLVQEIPAVADKLMQAFWPGNVTLVFQASSIIPEQVSGGTGTIGVRLAAHSVSRALIEAAGCPLTGTSANLSGSRGCARITELERNIVDSVDVILDTGKLPGIVGSTVVDVTLSPPRIIREGLLSAREVKAVCGALS